MVRYMQEPIVSIIITTRNEEEVIKNLLESIKKQTFKRFEIILVDNNSTDKTVSIAKQYTKAIHRKGPERSVQRNYGAQKARGKYLLFLDADMELSPTILAECVKNIEKEKSGGVIIPEESFGKGYWTQIKAFERTFYIGDETIEAARLYKKKIFDEIKGFDINITGPEDWDLSERVKKKYTLTRIKSFIRHNEGTLSLTALLQKKYYYGLKASRYLANRKSSAISSQTIYMLRPAFYRGWKRLLRNPANTVAMILMLNLEQIAGAAGYLKGKGQK